MLLYISAIHIGAMFHLVNAVLLIMRRKQGQSSRMILGIFQLLTVFNYILLAVTFHAGENSAQVMTVPMLLIGVFMMITYMIYPIEVISPGWINHRKIIAAYSPIIILYIFYKLTIWMGIEYPPYISLMDMLPDIKNSDVLFRFILCLLIFITPLLFYYMLYTSKYSNKDRVWVRNYIIIALIKSMAYTAVLTFENIPVHIIYYYITTITALYLTYIELFVRIIPQNTIKSVEHSAEILSNQTPTGAVPSLFIE